MFSGQSSGLNAFWAEWKNNELLTFAKIYFAVEIEVHLKQLPLWPLCKGRGHSQTMLTRRGR